MESRIGNSILQNANASSKSKVYINPNFNRNLLNSNHQHHSMMHINPNFSQVMTQVHNKSKIFVNPNFIKSKDNCESKKNHNNTATTEENLHKPNIENTNIVRVNVSNKPVTVSQSRYCLVRHNVAKQESPVREKSSNTFKLNKYKSVPLNDLVKNKLYNSNTDNLSKYSAQTSVTSISPTNKNSTISIRPHYRKNQFKFINNTVKTKLGDVMNSKVYPSCHITPTSMTKVKNNLKKNNIPCPSFRKFGRCLRLLRGGCEFLHDKKHVSICRKFIKGLCHEKDCLLSHDLTSKKMPTCYFYLQGSCTNENCSYLHVKLNEKTKVCKDFLNGYCDNGSKCLQRHVIMPKHKDKTISAKHKLSQKIKLCKVKTRYKSRQSKQQFLNSSSCAEKQSGMDDKALSENREMSSEYRYYLENNEKGTSETIRPMRCKLGTLPSFIQL